MLFGKAHSNVHNGEKDMGEGLILRGIPQKQTIGFLTLYEAYNYFEVGTHFKTPELPIWMICSESHYSILFSPDISMASSSSMTFDMLYYDELAK